MRLHLHVEIGGRSVLVVGCGPAGREKARRLVDAGAVVTVVDPTPIHDDLRSAVTFEQRRFESGDVVGRWLVVAATGLPEVDDEVERVAHEAGIWVNRADRADGGDVTFGAVVRRGRVEVGVTTGGASPSLARWVRDRIEAALPAELAHLADLLAARPRKAGRREHRSVPIDAVLDALSRGEHRQAERLLDENALTRACHQW